MKHFFVIGNKVSKSLSPIIFNYWFKKYKIKAKYSFVEVKKNNFKKVLVKKINNKKTMGFNITIPFKKEAIQFLDIKNQHVDNIGAVNCVTLGKKIKGVNTDWLGYLGSIKDLKINKNKNIIILGYGGASKAIVYGLTLKGFKNIKIFNRSKKAININGIKSYTKKYISINKYLTNVDLLINTTPTNPLNKEQIKIVKKNTFISDIVYKPMNTIFLNSFKENRKIFGITMLIEQAIPCFRLWFGFNPDVDEVLIKKLKNKIK